MKEKFFMNGIFRDTEKGPWPFYSRCKNCGATSFPAELIMCNQCLCKELEQLDLPTEGEVETYAVSYRPVNMYPVPHTFGIVRFPEARLKVKGVFDLSDEYKANMKQGHEMKIGSKVDVFVDALWEDPDQDTKYIGYKFHLKEDK